MVVWSIIKKQSIFKEVFGNLLSKGKKNGAQEWVFYTRSMRTPLSVLISLTYLLRCQITFSPLKSWSDVCVVARSALRSKCFAECQYVFGHFTEPFFTVHGHAS